MPPQPLPLPLPQPLPQSAPDTGRLPPVELVEVALGCDGSLASPASSIPAEDVPAMPAQKASWDWSVGSLAPTETARGPQVQASFASTIDSLAGTSRLILQVPASSYPPPGAVIRGASAERERTVLPGVPQAGFASTAESMSEPRKLAQKVAATASTSLARAPTPISGEGQGTRASDRETPLLQDSTDSPTFVANGRHLTASVLNVAQDEPVDAVSFASVSQLTEQNLQNFTAQDQREVLIGQLYRLALSHRNQVQRFWPEVPDQERQLLDGEQKLLNIWYEKSVRYIRANNEMSERYLFRHTVLSALLAMTTLVVTVAISSPQVPLAVAMVSSLAASLINALQNYSQLTRLAHRHREAAQNWEELRRATFSLFDTCAVRAPDHRIAAVARAYESAMAQNPVLPLRLEQRSMKDHVRRLFPSETPLEPPGPQDSLSKQNIESLLNGMDSVEYFRRSVTRMSLRMQHLDFFTGMLIAMAMVGSTSGSIAAFLREDLHWVRYVVPACSGFVSAVGSLQNAVQPGTKAQRYLHAAHEASELLCRAEELLYCGPHLRMAQRVGELRRQCDTLLSNMRQQGLWHMDPDLPPEHLLGLFERSPMDIGSISHHSVARTVSSSRPGSQVYSRRPSGVADSVGSPRGLVGGFLRRVRGTSSRS